MIPLKFGLFWSGARLSYLRFLTFASLRKHHPESEIELYWNKSSNNKITWKSERQDFQTKTNGVNYIDLLLTLNIKIIESDLFPTYAPNYQSDFFRWWWLYNNGGFYLDTDQIILKPFNELPLNSDFIYSMYKSKSCGIYSPVGVIGASKGCPILKQIMEEMTVLYNPKDYNSLGPFMFRDLWEKNKKKWQKENVTFNAPSYFFYPVPESMMIDDVYNKAIHITGESYALHWYGGHNKSQEFNSKFTKGFSLESDDTISILSRKIN